jgi:hypothetical protein
VPEFDWEENEGRADGENARLAPTVAEESYLAEVVTLLRDYPRWAIWLPTHGRRWTSVRPASSRQPAPDLPMLWAYAESAGELARMMNAIDEQASGRGWFG